MGDRVCVLDIWYEHGCRVIYKGLGMLEDTFHKVKISTFSL